MGSPRVHDEVRPEAMSSADDPGDNFRLAMREFASGVAIIACGAGETRSGCTATAIASLSLVPADADRLPQSCDGDARCGAAAKAPSRSTFSPNATRSSPSASPAAAAAPAPSVSTHGDWVSLVTGAPMLADALAAMDCRVEEIIERHTHADRHRRRAKRCGFPAKRPALLHWRSRFETLAVNAPSPRRRPKGAVRAPGSRRWRRGARDARIRSAFFRAPSTNGRERYGEAPALISDARNA